jgi:protein phosphatase
VVDDFDPMMTSAVMPLVGENGADPRARRSHRARPRRSGDSSRRRWPIVTTALCVLAAVVIGGGYVFWRVSQNQYYVGTNSSGEVVIYRGINQRIAGFSWSGPYQQTGIVLAQVPSNYQQTVKTDYSTGSLSQVRQTVTNIQSAVISCRNAYTAQATWQTAEDKYNTEVALAKKAKKPTGGIAKPGQQPAPANALCPPSEVFGIAASALPSAAPGPA